MQDSGKIEAITGNEDLNGKLKNVNTCVNAGKLTPNF